MEQFKDCVCEPCYPEAFPSVALSNIVGYLRGSGDLGCALHCAWVVQGFAMSFIPHDHPQPIGDAFDKCPTEMTGPELATVLESTCAPHADADSAWILLLMPLIQEVVKRLLDRLNNR